jgi:hypothetical protein
MVQQAGDDFGGKLRLTCFPTVRTDRPETGNDVTDSNDLRCHAFIWTDHPSCPEKWPIRALEPLVCFHTQKIRAPQRSFRCLDPGLKLCRGLRIRGESSPTQQNVTCITDAWTSFFALEQRTLQLFNKYWMQLLLEATLASVFVLGQMPEAPCLLKEWELRRESCQS